MILHLIRQVKQSNVIIFSKLSVQVEFTHSKKKILYYGISYQMIMNANYNSYVECLVDLFFEFIRNNIKSIIKLLFSVL